MSRYETITGRHLDLGDLNREERDAFRSLQEAYQAAPDWEDFSTHWQRVLDQAYPKLSAEERLEKLLYDIAQDLEMRLGIQQGKVAPPDYRDYIVERIEEKYGSRYRFCKETGIAQGFLSQVLSGKKDFSLAKLREVADALDLGLALLPLSRIGDLPLVDSAALRRVSLLLQEELLTLKNFQDHLRRIGDPDKVATAIRKERELFENAIDRLSEKLHAVPEEQWGELVFPLLEKEIAGLEDFLFHVRSRMAAEADEEKLRGEAGGERQALSRV